MTYTYKCFHSDLFTGEPCNATKTEPFGLCPKCHKFAIASHEKILNFAIELDIAQNKENNGRGVSCVREIISYLFHNNVTLAKNVYYIDGDKICGTYPKLDKMICEFFQIEPRYGKQYTRWENVS